MAGPGFGFDPSEDELGPGDRIGNRREEDEVGLRIRLLRAGFNAAPARATTANQPAAWRWPMAFPDPEERVSEEQFSSPNRRLRESSVVADNPEGRISEEHSSSLRESSVAENDPINFFSPEQLALGDLGPGKLFLDERAFERAALGLNPVYLPRERPSMREQHWFGESSGLGIGARALGLDEALASASRNRFGTLLEEVGLEDIEPAPRPREQQARLERSAFRPAMYPELFAPHNVSEQDINAAMQRRDSAWREFEGDELSGVRPRIRPTEAEDAICPRCWATLEMRRSSGGRGTTLICPRCLIY